MFLSEQMLTEWAEDINTRVANEDDGAIVAGETSDEGLYFNAIGEYSEITKVLAGIVYSVAYQNAKGFEEVLADVTASFDKIKEDGGILSMPDDREGFDGLRYVDPKNSFGYNEADETIQFPPIPEDVQEKMLEFCKRHVGKNAELIEKLSNLDGIREVLEAAGESFRYGKDDDETLLVEFEYEGQSIGYSFNIPGHIVISGEDVAENGETMPYRNVELFEKDKTFRDFISYIAGRLEASSEDEG